MMKQELDERELLILHQARALINTDAKTNEIDSFFVFRFDPFWLSLVIQFREKYLKRSIPLDKQSAADRELGLQWEEGINRLRSVFRFDFEKRSFFGNTRDESEIIQRINGKFYECSEIDTSVLAWFAEMDSDEWDRLVRAYLHDKQARKTFQPAYEKALARAELCQELRANAWYVGADYGILREEFVKAILWDELPILFSDNNYLIIESTSRPTSHTIFSYLPNDTFPGGVEYENGVQLKTKLRRAPRTLPPLNPLYYPPPPGSIPGDPELPYPTHPPRYQLTMRTFVEEAIRIQGRNAPQHPAVRTRTWAIYRLTKRGGGFRSEPAALQIWGDFTRTGVEPTEADLKTYQRDRNALFFSATLGKKNGSQKEP